jgi:putative transposase
MMRSYKYRAYVNKSTEFAVNRWIELCRYLYNACLAQRIDAWRKQRKQVNYDEQQKDLTEVRHEYKEYGDMDLQIQRDVLHKIDYAYKSFFRRVKKGQTPGFPRFKSKSRYSSFTLHRHSWKLEGKYLVVRNLGRFKLKLSRPILGKIRAINIKRSAVNKWYVFFVCDDIPVKVFERNNKSVGIDVGIKSYLTDSEGNKVDNPKFLVSSQDNLKKKQRKFNRAQNKSKRREKDRLQVSKLHEKINNQKHDYLHKLSRQYINMYDIIKVENLNLEGMVKNHSLAQSINDCAWGTFFDMLEYKAEEAGKQVLRVPYRNTSRTCSKCGTVNKELVLKDRKWICNICGTLHDRDVNAAINIRRLGQSHQLLTCANTQCVS